MMSCVKIFSITKIAPVNKSFSGEEDFNDKSKKFNVPHFIDLGKRLASLNLDISLFHELLRLLKTRPRTENIRHRMTGLLTSILTQIDSIYQYLISIRFRDSK